MNYEVKSVNGGWAVWSIEDSAWITKEIRDKKIAEEICKDFNKMSNKDFTPIGMPDFSKTKYD